MSDFNRPDVNPRRFSRVSKSGRGLWWRCCLGGLAVSVVVGVSHAGDAEKRGSDPLPEGAIARLRVGGVPVSLRVAPDATKVAAACNDGTLRVWDWRTSKVVLERRTGPFPPKAVAFCDDGQAVAWINKHERDGGAVVALDGRTVRRLILADERVVHTAVFSRDGSTLATSGFVTGIRLWSTSSGKQLANLGVADGLATAMSISRDNALLATAAQSNTAGGRLLEVWRIATGECLLCPKRGGEEIASVAFSPDGKYLAAGAQGIEIYELATGKMADRFGQTSPTQSLAFSPNGRMLAYRVANRLHFHDLIAGRPSEGIPAAQMTVTAFAFSEDGHCIATGGADGTVLLWAAPNPQDGPPTPLTANQLDALWQDLAAADAAAGYRALRGLVAAGGPAVALLKERLKPSQPPEPGLPDRLIVQLDSDNWSERETASGRLAKLGEAARPALQRALEETKSAEVKWRARALLNALASPLSAPPEALRYGRAMAVLELMGTDEAEAALAALADVGLGRLGADARASLNRLRRAGHDSHRPQ